MVRADPDAVRRVLLCRQKVSHFESGLLSPGVFYCVFHILTAKEAQDVSKHSLKEISHYWITHLFTNLFGGKTDLQINFSFLINSKRDSNRST